ncbi:hypothetical protein BH09BAC3_BH09BAC3_07480 [soil metagenome]
MNKLFVLLMILCSAGCVAPISLDYPGAGGALVVDGWITNRPGPYIIKLSRSVPYDNSKSLKVYSIPERSVKVSIVDDLGNIEILTEMSTAGSYKTNTLSGVVGRKYQLKIETKTGKYSSVPEQMVSVPNIKKFEARFQVSEVLFTNANGSARVQKKEDFGFYVTISDPADAENFYRWQATGIFEYFSTSEQPVPTHCWAPTQGKIEPNLQLASDVLFNGQEYTQYLGLIAYDRPTYYLATLNQQSLTPSAYKFLKQLKDQQTSTGTLFDPPPTAISGNIYNENNSREVVLGYFGVSEVKQVNLLINRLLESGYVNPSRYSPPLPGNCLPQQPESVSVPPPGFPG